VNAAVIPPNVTKAYMKILAAGTSVLALLVGLFVGRAWNDSPSDAPNSSDASGSFRYHLEFDTIMGGFGGVTIVATDREEQKSFLYLLPPKPKTDTAGAKLIGTVDLNSVGEEVLDFSFSDSLLADLSNSTVSIGGLAELANESTTPDDNGFTRLKTDVVKSIGDEFILGNLSVKIVKVEKLMLKSNSWTTPTPKTPSFVFTIRVTNVSEGKILTPSLSMSTLDNFGNSSEYISLKVDGNEHKKKLKPGDSATLKEHFMPSIDTATNYECSFTLYEGDSWDNTKFTLNFIPSEHSFDAAAE
jgi:hypothetical protein